MHDIKNCPFCGKTPDFNDPDFCYPVARPDENGVQLFRAGCIAPDCGAEILVDSKEHAILRWNTRKQ